MLATLIRITGDMQLAQDVVQDALLKAMQAWPRTGVPDSPRAWIVRTARNAAIDRVRRRQRFDARRDVLSELANLDAPKTPEEQMDRFPDDRLKLIFTCCHPALALEARVALTLRTLGGLTTDEIARAFLVASPTMAQRLVRAKRKIRAAGIPYEVPPPKHVGDRVAGVRQVLYLIFNEGYGASSGHELVRVDLAEEAIHLGSMLGELRPEPETAGLLALMMLHHARRGARMHEGEIVLLEHQDRSLWDHKAIDRALPLVEEAMPRAGPYALQAAIAALHCTASSWEETDWKQIEALYRLLRAQLPGPVVALNHAVAVAMWLGPAAGLAQLDDLHTALEQHHLFHAARAALLVKVGRTGAAFKAYQAALERVGNEPERRFLLGRLASLHQ